VILIIKGIEAVLLSSENARKLAKFYQDMVGLKLVAEMVIGENNEGGFTFEFNQGTSLYILDHSKIKGKSKEPPRVMVNLEVDKIEDEVERLKKAGVKVVQGTYHVEGYGFIATFEDLDGNYFQLVQVRPN